jgi:hypothetical protein
MDKRMARGGSKSYFPTLGWLPHDKSEWLQFDMIAALSVWALLGCALFGTSGQIVTVPGATIGAVSGGLVFGFGIGLIPDQTPKVPGVPMASGSYFQVRIGVLIKIFSNSRSKLRDLGRKAGT